MSARLLGAKQRFNKERIQLAENLQSARVARMRKLITARVRKNKRTARMLANAGKRPFDTPTKGQNCSRKLEGLLTQCNLYLNHTSGTCTD